MSLADIMTIISTIGFPIFSTIILGIFISQTLKFNREDSKNREERHFTQITNIETRLQTIEANLNTILINVSNKNIDQK